MKTIGKNTKAYKNAIANASSIKIYTLDNYYIGEPVNAFDSNALESGKLTIAGDCYCLYVHSRCYYKFTAK